MQSVLLGFTASNCIVFGEYVLFAANRVPAEHPAAARLLALGLMTAVTIVHGCFLRTGILIQNILGWIKIGLVMFMVGASAVVVLSGHRPRPASMIPSDRGSETPFLLDWDRLWEGSVWNWGVISTALFKVFYSYAGLQNVNNVMNEVQDPVRTLKSAATVGLLTSCLLYLLVNVAYFLIVPLDEIKKSGELIAALFFERLFGQTWGRKVLPLAVATSAVGNVMVVTFAFVSFQINCFFTCFSQFLTKRLAKLPHRLVSTKRLPVKAFCPSASSFRRRDRSVHPWEVWSYITYLQ